VAVKLAEVTPAATVMVAGTDSLALLLEIVIVSPPAGAALTKVKLQVALAPAVKWLGVQVSDVSGTIPIETEAVWGRPFSAAVTVTIA
jgi:hypothetical protein